MAEFEIDLGQHPMLAQKRKQIELVFRRIAAVEWRSHPGRNPLLFKLIWRQR